MGKIKCLCSSLVLFLGFASGPKVDSSRPVIRQQNNQSTQVVAEESESTSGKDKIKQYFDEFIAPLFVGVTGASIFGSILSICVAILNRQNNKKSREEVTKSHQEIIDITTKAADVIKSVGAILNTLEDQNEVTEELKQSFLNSTNSLLEKIGKLTLKTEDLMQLKQIIVTQARIQSKIALSTKDVVASGVGEEIRTLSEQIKQL